MAILDSHASEIGSRKVESNDKRMENIPLKIQIVSSSGSSAGERICNDPTEAPVASKVHPLPWQLAQADPFMSVKTGARERRQKVGPTSNVQYRYGL